MFSAGSCCARQLLSGEWGRNQVAPGPRPQTDVTDPRGYVRRVTFNSSGYPLTDIQALGTPQTQGTTYERNVSNLAYSNMISRVTDALGRNTDLTYDSLAFLRALRTGFMPSTLGAPRTDEPVRLPGTRRGAFHLYGRVHPRPRGRSPARRRSDESCSLIRSGSLISGWSTTSESRRCNADCCRFDLLFSYPGGVMGLRAG